MFAMGLRDILCVLYTRATAVVRLSQFCVIAACSLWVPVLLGWFLHACCRLCDCLMFVLYLCAS